MKQILIIFVILTSTSFVYANVTIVYDSELRRAILKEDPDLAHIERLLKEGADPNQPIHGSVVPLHQVVYKGHLDLVKLLLENGAEIDSADAIGYRPLHYAIETGRLDIAEFLLEKGSDPNKIVDGVLPLHSAILRGGMEMTELLLKKGARPNDTNSDGESPTSIAIQRDKFEILGLLYKNGAKFDKSVTDKDSLLLHAQIAGRQEIIDFLSKKEAGPNRVIDGETLLLRAVRDGNLFYINLLLTRGADPHKAEAGANSAFGEAVESGLLDIAELLLKTSNATAPNVCKYLGPRLHDSSFIIQLTNVPSKIASFSPWIGHCLSDSHFKPENYLQVLEALVTIFEADEHAIPIFVQSLFYENQMISRDDAKLKIIEHLSKLETINNKATVMAESFKALLSASAQIKEDSHAKAFTEATGILMGSRGQDYQADPVFIQSIVDHYDKSPIDSRKKHLIFLLEQTRPSDLQQSEAVKTLAETESHKERKMALMQWAHRYPAFLIEAFQNYSSASEKQKSKIILGMDDYIVKHALEDRLLDFRILIERSSLFHGSSDDRNALITYLNTFIKELHLEEAKPAGHE